MDLLGGTDGGSGGRGVVPPVRAKGSRHQGLELLPQQPSQLIELRLLYLNLLLLLL